MCAGGYTAQDMKFIRSYPNKMFKWGYFPVFRQYDLNELISKKNNTLLGVNTSDKLTMQIDYYEEVFCQSFTNHLYYFIAHLFGVIEP